MTEDATSEALRLITRGTDVIAPEGALADKLDLDRPLRVKLGMDPTAPSVTLGWAVVLRKLRHFQELGHTAVLIVGDFTAQVGDPSGKSETRTRLNRSEVLGFAERLLGQFQRVLLPEPLEVRYNSEWLERLGMEEILELTSKVTVAQMLERSDFANRYESGSAISMMEFLYPLLQGYDSVAVQADIEIGGADQLWNLMMGRVIQDRYGVPPQVAVTVPLLVGTDGVQKMSQSLGNYIGVEDSSEDMFGKTMSIPDELIGQWLSLAADRDAAEVRAILRDLATGDRHPNQVKRALARDVVTLYRGVDAAVDAEAHFDLVHRHGGVPDEMPEHALPAGELVSMGQLLRDAGLASSGGEARRLVDQGGVRVDDVVIDQVEIPREELAGRVLRVGKRRFVRLVG